MLKKMNAKQKVRKKKGGEGGEIRRKKIFFSHPSLCARPYFSVLLVQLRVLGADVPYP